MACSARAMQRNRRAGNCGRHGTGVLGIEDEHHALATAKENMPAIFAGMFFQANHLRVEPLGRIEVGRREAAFQYSQRLHVASMSVAPEYVK